MTHTRPSATGWVTGQQSEPVEITADPPGDGIGPDLTAPDRIDGQDAREYRRLAKDHEKAVRAVNTHTLDEPDRELHETAEIEPTPYQFPKGHPTSWMQQDPETEAPADDPREQKAAAKDPREGDGKS